MPPTWVMPLNRPASETIVRQCHLPEIMMTLTQIPKRAFAENGRDSALRSATAPARRANSTPIRNSGLNRLKLIFRNLSLTAALGLLAGCVSPSYDKGAATSAALTSAAWAASRTSASVNAVLEALNALTFKAEGDLRPQYEDLVAATRRLAQSNENLAAKARALREAATAHSESWSNQLDSLRSPELRQRGSERMNEIVSRLRAMDASYAQVKNALRPFVADVRDIQTYLGADLTADGLASLKDIVSRTKVKALPLRDSLKQLRSSLTSLGAALSPVLPAAEKK